MDMSREKKHTQNFFNFNRIFLNTCNFDPYLGLKQINVYLTYQNSQIINDQELIKLLPILQKILQHTEYKVENRLKNVNMGESHFAIVKRNNNEFNEDDFVSINKLIGGSSEIALTSEGIDYIRQYDRIHSGECQNTPK